MDSHGWQFDNGHLEPFGLIRTFVPEVVVEDASLDLSDMEGDLSEENLEVDDNSNDYRK